MKQSRGLGKIQVLKKSIETNFQNAKNFNDT